MTESVSADFVRQVRLALGVLAGQTSMSPTNELGALVGGKAYVETGMSDQNADLLQNDHIAFNQPRIVDASGRIVQSTGTGQQLGLFTLTAGGVYLCVCFIAVTFSPAAGTATFHWRNNTTSLFVGGQAGLLSPASGSGLRGFCQLIIAPDVQTEIEVRQNSSPTNLTQIDGSGPQQETMAFIVEIA